MTQELTRQTPCALHTPSRRTWRIRRSGVYPQAILSPLTRSKCRRRRRGAPPCRRHARGGGRFPVLLPLRARNRLWFGPTKQFRVGRYVANRRSVNSKTLPQWVYSRSRCAFTSRILGSTELGSAAVKCHFGFKNKNTTFQIHHIAQKSRAL